MNSPLEVSQRLHQIAKSLAVPNRRTDRLEPYTHLIPANYKHEKSESLLRSLYANLLEDHGFEVSFEDKCVKKGCSTERRDLVLSHSLLDGREIYIELKVFAYGDIGKTGDLKEANRIKLHNDIYEKLHNCAKSHPGDYTFMGVIFFYALENEKYPAGKTRRASSKYEKFLNNVETLYGVQKLTDPITLFGLESESALTEFNEFTLDFMLLNVSTQEFAVAGDNKNQKHSVEKAHKYYLQQIRKKIIKDEYRKTVNKWKKLELSIAREEWTQF